MSLEKKVSYLAGLAEGLDISKKTPEGKLLLAIIETLEDMAEEINSVGEYVDELDDDLLELEEYVYDDDDCDCDDCCDCDDDCDCCDYDRCDGCECDGDCDDCDCEDDCDECECGDDGCCCCDCDDEFDYVEYECPNCHKTISFSGDFADDELVCPDCGAKLKTR